MSVSAGQNPPDSVTVPNDIFSLEPPNPAPVVIPSQASGIAPKVAAERVPMLDEKVDEFLTVLQQSEPGSPEVNAQADAIRSMGDADIRRAAETSNRLLETPVKAVQEGGVAEGSTVAKSLLELRRTVEELDPAGARGSSKKILGIFPVGKGMTDYFRKYQSSQDNLNAILHALRSGQDELGKDNAALNLEKQNLWEIMGRLNQYVYIAEQLDTKLETQINQLRQIEPDRASSMSQDVLFYVRQKHQDLLTQLAVSVQSYLALDIIIKNNIELIKGVDRASTTTVSALRTAVIVAQALGNQKLVLDQISALNSTTSTLIESTSVALKANSGQIQEQAASSTIGIEQLQRAFANIYETMDSIDQFKLRALDTMKQTVNVLEGEVVKSKVYLERVRTADKRGELPVITID